MIVALLWFWQWICPNMPIVSTTTFPVAIIGAGPAGLMAAEVLAERGIAVHLYDSMPMPARKFLLAGRGGLNLTHAEPFAAFVARYGARARQLEPLLASFGPEQLRVWAAGLGIDTFVGSSGRVFPTGLKASPLLRAWLARLDRQGVRFFPRHRWLGWGEGGELRFASPSGVSGQASMATILALGGGSYRRLGSDGAWVPVLAERGVNIRPLSPANCGFDIGWSEHFRTRHAGIPLKTVCLSFAGQSIRGDVMLTATGIEGGPVYALSASLRDALDREGRATALLDLKPDWSESRLAEALSRPRGSRSLATHIERATSIRGAAAGLLRECLPPEIFGDPARLAAPIKAVPLCLKAARPLDEAISSAGGIAFEELDERLMICRLPGVFAAGEMLDWVAPTGGYLLTACLAIGRAAGQGAANWLNTRPWN